MSPFASRCSLRTQWDKPEQNKARCDPTSQQLGQPKWAFRGRYTCPADLWGSGLCWALSRTGYKNPPHEGDIPSSPSWQLEITYSLQFPCATSWKGAHATLPPLPLTQSCTTAPAATCSEASPAVPLRSGERLCWQGAETAQNHDKLNCKLPRPMPHPAPACTRAQPASQGSSETPSLVMPSLKWFWHSSHVPPVTFHPGFSCNFTLTRCRGKTIRLNPRNPTPDSRFADTCTSGNTLAAFHPKAGCVSVLVQSW